MLLEGKIVAFFETSDNRPIGVGYGKSWISGVDTFIHACNEAGMPTVTDNNAGKPVGVAVCQFNVANGERCYSASAFLPPSKRAKLNNLTIVTETYCGRILFDGKKAVGIEARYKNESQAVNVRARKEIILCAGAISSPHILLRSGVGPRQQIKSHDIPVVADIPGVGQNFQDHSALSFEYLVDPETMGHNQIMQDPERLKRAEEQYKKDKSGPLAYFGASAGVAFPKLPRLYESEEFKALPRETQQFLLEKNRPSCEFYMCSGPLYYTGKLDPKDSCLAHECLMQNNLSRGSITLASADPRDDPIIDPNYLSHPFDRRIAIETLRELIRMVKGRTYEPIIRKLIHGPRDSLAELDAENTEDLETFIQKFLGGGYHAMSTCRMGSPSDTERVVNSDFKVVGMQGLRVADLSVCPILTTNHTQINAYLIGEVCARTLIAELTPSSKL